MFFRNMAPKTLLDICFGYIIISLTLFQVGNGVNADVHPVTYLQPGSRIPINASAVFQQSLKIFCYRGRPKHIINIWQTALLQLGDISSEKYERYDGASPKGVIEEYEQRRSSWAINVFAWKQKNTGIELNPFNQSCVGIDTSESYRVHLNIIRIDYWRVLLLGAGILLFFSAPKLSTNALFYYIVGITVGICASFLILVYMMSKLLPKICYRNGPIMTHRSQLPSHVRLRRPSINPLPARLIERHFIEKIPPTGSKARPQKKCAVFKAKKNKRKDTVYWYPDCQVGLCLEFCFKEFHTQPKFVNTLAPTLFFLYIIIFKLICKLFKWIYI